ncbi:RNA polymerase sigma factor [Aestuariispira ectoiniformans]|uniref:RNA polymerase sigma factor n=1 Tax=Aestuariispira ectoiniformans TaxID=2775080 RepID=UPI00223BF25A|nr:RNA polymerase sigma factor [Aestuariispira ectoiniformans]
MNRGDELKPHIQSLRRYAIALVGNPSEADDLVQEALRRVLEHTRRNHDIHNVKSYLFKALRNVRLDQLKMARTRGVEVPVEDAAGALSTAAQQDTRLECRDLDRAMTTLTDDQRQVVLMICMEGLSYEEVADVVDVPVGTVRSRLHRGREALREYMNCGSDKAMATAPVTRLNKELNEATND